MQLIEWDELLTQLADDPADYSRQNDLVMLVRQGREHILTVKETSPVGLAVQVQEADGRMTYVAAATWIQRELLGLTRLASQIVRAVDKIQLRRPGAYVESPAIYHAGDAHLNWDEARTELINLFHVADPGSTQILQLMAPAGQGKTALLENAAVDLARQYTPEPFPIPLLLVVDLLARGAIT